MPTTISAHLAIQKAPKYHGPTLTNIHTPSCTLAYPAYCFCEKKISSPPLPLLKQHTVPSLKTQHFPSLPQLHLGTWPKHALITFMPQTLDHALTTPYHTTLLQNQEGLRALLASWAGSTGLYLDQISNRLLRTVEWTTESQWNTHQATTRTKVPSP